MNDSELARRVLRHVNAENYRPAKPRVIAKQLQLSKEQGVQLKREIKRLVKQGRLAYAANHFVVPVASSRGAGDLVGVFRRAMAGYGFVRPRGTKREVGRNDDIFIPASRTKDAASGDTVRVRLTRRGPRRRSDSFAQREGKRSHNRTAGEILQVIDRARKQFVGTYEPFENLGHVHLDGTEFSRPVIVGDPGAKRVQAGDKVVVELIHYPTARRPGEGVITEVLGDKGKPGVDTLTVLREFALPDQFPEDVLQAARDVAESFDGQLTDGRQDLTQLPVVTIDPRDARDFDDAISLERLDNGHWRLGVHIADVSYFVRPRTPLDREARDRATSVYLPDRVIPMLPEVISNHLASLQPDQVRFVKTAFIEYTEDGIRVATDFCSAAIRSRRRFTYEEVDDFLADRATWRARLGPELDSLLGNMHQLAMRLRRRRLDNGSIELELPEIKIQLDQDGRVEGARRVEHTESHQVIEEFMLAANEAVAERFSDDGLAFLRRVHGSPDPVKLEQLTEFVRELGIKCESLESRFEIIRVLAEVADQPIASAVNYAVLRSMQKAVYSPEDTGHYALAIQNYCHFTSPIRRYPDLTIHRLMETVFQGDPQPQPNEQLLSLGDHCSEREQRAEAAERELIKLKLLAFLEDKIGQPLDVVVTGVEEFGLFAQGIELPAEGLIHVDALPQDVYYYDGPTHALMGHRQDHVFRLGDLLRVEIAEVDLDRRELDFAFRQRLKPDQALQDPFQMQGGKFGKDSARERRDSRQTARSAKRRAEGKRARKHRRKGRRH